MNATAQDIRRLGQYRKESERPRPVRVSFTSEKERDEVLSSAYKLNRNRKDKDERISVNVAMRKDLTVQEREEEDRLFAELKKRREEAKNLWGTTIQGG